MSLKKASTNALLFLNSIDMCAISQGQGLLYVSRVCMYVCMNYVCVCVYVFFLMHVYVDFIDMYATYHGLGIRESCMYVCLFVCMYSRTYVCLYVHDVGTYMCMYICAYVYTYVCMH
jgi:hypothetical protein